MANLRVDKITSTETFEKTGSVQFDGSGDYLSIPSSTDFDFSSDYTIEGFFCASALTSRHIILDTRPSGASTPGYTLFIDGNNSNILSFDVASSQYLDSSSTIEKNSWYHFAICRNGNTARLFLNGVLETTVSSSQTLDASDLIIGFKSYTSSSLVEFQGFISNLRIIKGTALYTENFKPPMRELEVVPGTVLLACQSKTDAALEKTGKTITVTGNAVASELTPGILTPVPKAGAGSAITGSVEFDGSGTTSGGYLELEKEPFQFLHKLTDSWTAECWIYKQADTQGTIFDTGGSSATTIGTALYINSGGNVRLNVRQALSSLTAQVSVDGVIDLNEWLHIASTYDQSTLKFFVNGILVGSTSYSTESSTDSNREFRIGVYDDTGLSGYFNGHISNLRIIKGTALYTDDFIPPTRELKKIPGTVLLCCQDPDNPLTEATGKTITGYGDITASNFTPQVGDDRKVTFEGVTKINTENYFYLPTGDTASRETTGTYNAGTRGLYHSGEQPNTATYDTIEYLTIASTGSVNDFGNLTNQKLNQVACSSDTRGLFATGYTPSPASGNNFIDYVTIMSTGNAQDFGDLTYLTYVPDALSNQTRGIIAGGAAAPNFSGQTNMDYVTIASKGDGKDFGDLTRARHSLSGLASPTRGVFAAGNASPVANLNNIDYVTIASTGNAQDFGDIGTGRAGPAGASSAIRGLFAGGYNPSVLNSIDFITIASTGNTQDFGDLTAIRRFPGGTSSSIRAVFMAGFNPAATNTIDFVSIQTTGNATDFGDTTINKTQSSACSNGHGGLG